jgi:U3 small nucleolar ribonucleoprotein protein IMP3
MRKLKYHEQRLLRKVNFLEWKKTNTTREHRVCSKYYLQARDEYHNYNKLVGDIRKLSNALSRLKDSDETKNRLGRKLVQKLWSLGVIDSKRLVECSKISVSSFCNRRLSSVMIRNKMVPNMKDCVGFIEQGHVRFGSRVVNDPGLIISRGMEDFVTWTDTSKIRQKIGDFKEEHDDYNYI